MLTVREVWQGALPAGTELIAGGAGLERRVDWSTALRTKPPAFDPVKGGELAIVPVERLRALDDRLDLAEVMRTLAEKGGTAIAIIGTASAEAIAVADRMMMPLLRLPAGSLAAEVHHAAVRYILDQRSRVDESDQALRRQLMDLALGGAGMSALVDALASLVGQAAVWLDAGGTVRHLSGTDAAGVGWLCDEVPGLHRWVALTPLSAADPPVRRLHSGTEVAMIAPIPLRGRVEGWIGIAGAAGRLSGIAHSAVARAASAAAIEADRHRAVTLVRDDLQGDLVAALVEGGLPDAAARDRAQRLEVDLDGPLAVMVIRCAADRLDETLAGMRTAVAQRAPRTPVGRHGDHVCLLLGAADPGGAATLAAALMGAAGGHVRAAGLSGPREGLRSLAITHAEAEQAATMGRRLFGEGQLIPFQRLGLYRLLTSMADHPELRRFVDDRLGPLRAHDRRGGDLTATLDAFLACHGSTTETAARLGLHRNTVLYRLHRIADVAALDLDDPLVRLELHLALRADEILKGGAATAPGGAGALRGD